MVSAWHNIAKLNTHLEPFNVSLHKLFTGIIGDGSSIRFWIDTWLDNEPLCFSFPALFKMETSKGCVIKDRCTGNGLISQWEWNWSKPPSAPDELQQLQALLTRIHGLNLTDQQDKWIWAPNPSHPFTVKAMRNYLQSTFFGPKNWAFPWNKIAPLKSNVLAWKLEMNRLPTKDMLLQRNILSSSPSCPLCFHHEETASHLFLECPFAKELWSFILLWCKLPLVIPTMLRDLFQLHKNPLIDPKKSKLLNLIIFAYVGIIWKTRNDRIFSGKKPSMRYVKKELKSTTFLWISNKMKHPKIEWSQWSSFNF
uniref:uncharacterized protein LOC122589068 n=1 Tax=Erigeron canadensis TaxID=72917 RepID=UPI001CB934DF|nr:uncharacterized protein LOC122589068 [Erigeron canadensis]